MLFCFPYWVIDLRQPANHHLADMLIHRPLDGTRLLVLPRALQRRASTRSGDGSTFFPTAHMTHYHMLCPFIRDIYFDTLSKSVQFPLNTFAAGVP
jgi:hypothetical protein